MPPEKLFHIREAMKEVLGHEFITKRDLLFLSGRLNSASQIICSFQFKASGPFEKVDKLQDLVQLDSGYKSGSGPCFMLFLSFYKLSHCSPLISTQTLLNLEDFSVNCLLLKPVCYVFKYICKYS